MSRVIYAIPVAASCIKQASECFAKWRAMGYGTVALVDGTIEQPENCDHVFTVSQYHGYAWAINCMADMLTLPEYGGYDWLVIGGHDVTPDPRFQASSIATQCHSHFGNTYGVMQPCGDAYGSLKDKSACVSPWIGAEFCKKHGPLHAGYFHFWCDTELKEVAEREGVLWWRDDLTQYHDHHLRHERIPGQPRHPEHLNRAVKAHDADKALFLKRKAAGFPINDPLGIPA